MNNTNDLPEPISRQDKYKSFMCNKLAGNNLNIDDLPEPISRQDKYNMFLCENIGAGGGSGGVANAFNSIEQTESVINFKSDNTTRATLDIITDEEINTIINSLT